MVGDPEDLHRVVELAAAVRAEPVVAVGREVLELGHQDLAHLAGRAGDQRDAAPSATYFAIVAPLLIVSSSGWAWTSSSLWLGGSVRWLGDSVTVASLGPSV